jgi:hypothetical protein
MKWIACKEKKRLEEEGSTDFKRKQALRRENAREEDSKRVEQGLPPKKRSPKKSNDSPDKLFDRTGVLGQGLTVHAAPVLEGRSRRQSGTVEKEQDEDMEEKTDDRLANAEERLKALQDEEDDDVGQLQAIKVLTREKGTMVAKEKEGDVVLPVSFADKIYDDRDVVQIQALHRGNEARRKHKGRRQQKNEEAEIGEAATAEDEDPYARFEERDVVRIQALHRGNEARRKHKGRRQEAGMGDNVQEEAAEAATAEDEDPYARIEERDVVRIQALHRGNEARRKHKGRRQQKKEEAEIEGAATAEDEDSYARFEERDVVRIQALHRGNEARRKHKGRRQEADAGDDVQAEEAEAATAENEDPYARFKERDVVRIQALHRGNEARRQHTVLRQEAEDGLDQTRRI